MSIALKICGIGILCTVTVIIIKQYRAEFSLPLRIAAIIITAGSVFIALEPAFTYMNSIGNEYGISLYVKHILKALGIAMLTNISAGICRDCGETSTAGMVELAGKAELILMSLPLIEEITSAVGSILAQI